MLMRGEMRPVGRHKHKHKHKHEHKHHSLLHSFPSTDVEYRANALSPGGRAFPTSGGIRPFLAANFAPTTGQTRGNLGRALLLAGAVFCWG